MDPAAVVVFPFGVNDELLTNEAFKCAKPKAIFTTDNFEKLFYSLRCSPELFIAEEKENEYLSTLGFVRQFAELAREKNGIGF